MTVDADRVDRQRTEFVEWNGIGHPNSLCDGVAGAVSRRLCRFYLFEVGRILHHNTDKVHLGSGRSNPTFDGVSLPVACGDRQGNSQRDICPVRRRHGLLVDGLGGRSVQRRGPDAHDYHHPVGRLADVPV